MDALPAPYLLTLAGQIASLSAFLGGFSATYLAMLLTLDARSRAVTWAIGSALVSAAAFIVATVAATVLVAGLQPETPPRIAASLPVDRARLLMGLCFGIGLYGALTSLGCSGWIRSRRMGQAATGVAVAAGVTIATLLGKVG